MPVRPKVEASRGGAATDFAAEIENTIRLSRLAATDRSAVTERPPSAADEWGETLDLVVHATEIIGAAQSRIAALEERNRDLETTFSEELRGLAARVAAAEQELARTEQRRAAAEQRAERAEKRADAAADWLRRIREHAAAHLRR